jgi:hypothetical protein
MSRHFGAAASAGAGETEVGVEVISARIISRTRARAAASEVTTRDAPAVFMRAPSDKPSAAGGWRKAGVAFESGLNAARPDPRSRGLEIVLSSKTV